MNLTLRSSRSTWKLSCLWTRFICLLHAHLNQHVCRTLLLAAVFYQAIYSSVSCLICFVWRKVNLEIEANWSQFKWSQAELFYWLLTPADSSPNTGRHNLIHEPVSVFWCSPSHVLVSNWKNELVLALQQFAWQWKKCGWNYRSEGELNLRGHLRTWKLRWSGLMRNSSTHKHSKYCRILRISAGALKRIKDKMSWQKKKKFSDGIFLATNVQICQHQGRSQGFSPPRILM